MKVCLFVNHACNLRCSYCYNGEKFYRPMPLEVALRGVDLATGGGRPPDEPVEISFFGGEPLLEIPLIHEVVDYATSRAGERRLRFQIVTNGTLLDPDTVDYLFEHRFYVGVSLDGCREAHDAGRRYADGRSSYERVAASVATLARRGEGVGLKVISVIDPANVDHLPDSLDALLDLGARNLSMNVNYEAEWDEGARERFSEALARLGERYVDAHRRGVAFSLNLLDSKIVTHLKGGFACSDRCDFGCTEVAVAPSGRLYPCDRLVGQDDAEDVVIGDVWAGVDVHRRDALIHDKNQVLADCMDCALVGRCMHWCGCVNHAMTGSVGGVSGLLCWFEQQLVEEADRCASALFAEQNDSFLRRFYAPRVRTVRS